MGFARSTRWIGLIAVLGLTSGCDQRDAERAIVIPDSTLTVVLADLHLADARARLPGGPQNLRDSVLAFHNLDEETFQQAMTGFVDHPDDLVNLYNKVLDKLNAARTP